MIEQCKHNYSSVLLFDVNETLLNIEPLKKHVDDILLEEGISNLWFSSVLQYSLSMTVSSQYESFMDIGTAVLTMMAKNRNINLTVEDARDALQIMLHLKPHKEVSEALTKLQIAGFRMATLSNSSSAASKIQLDNAGISDFFERCFSIDHLGKYKPHSDVYNWAARAMNKSAHECMLVAEHPWDVAGAAWAGMKTAFITRGGKSPFPLAIPPNVTANDILDLSNQLVTSR